MEHRNTIFQCIINISNHVNLNGGFTVKVWYKKGEVDDQSNKHIITAANLGAVSIYPIHIVHNIDITTDILSFDSNTFKVTTLQG